MTDKRLATVNSKLLIIKLKYNYVLLFQRAPSLDNQTDLIGKDSDNIDVIPANKRDGWPKSEIQHIIVDCSMMSYVDSVGVNMLKSVSWDISLFIQQHCISVPMSGKALL